MNKKIFTLLASLLMLFLTAIVVNAQVVRNFYGPDVPFLPEGMGKGAYHLKVSSIGDNKSTAPAWWADLVLALDESGYLTLVDENYVMENYKQLAEALWCVNVDKPELQGRQPIYNFINKAYQTPLSVDTGRWIDRRATIDPTKYYHSDNPTPSLVFPQWTGNLTNVFVGGPFANWSFSHEYEFNMLKDKPLLIPIPDEDDYFMTFATKLHNSWGRVYGTVELVKIHIRDLDPGNHFADNSVIRFTLVNAAPRVLTAEDFNTTLWTDPDGTSSKLIFNPDTRPADKNPNVLAQELRAYDSPNNAAISLPWRENYYMNFQIPHDDDEGDYIYVADGDDEDNYYNDSNIRYPKILEMDYDDAEDLFDTVGTTPEEFDFRLVYYPSEDSVIVNVRGITHIRPTYGNTIPAGHALDLGNYNLGDNYLFNREIWDFLIVRMQDLVNTLNERVVTVSNRPANTRIHFGIQSCEISDDRIAVPRNLYVIRDAEGRYLVMPLELGDFTPQWIEPRNNEDPMKTPSYQWLVYPMNENSPNSSIVLTNREFDWVQIEWVNIYKKPHLFEGTYAATLSGLNADYYNIFGTAGNAKVYYSTAETDDPYMIQPELIKYNNITNKQWSIVEGWHGSFLVVQDDKAAAAKKAADLPLTVEETQKLYRTSSLLGYHFIAEDTLSYFTYSFNHLHAYATDRYLGPKPSQFTDTLIYGVADQNHFELRLPDVRSKNHKPFYGTEKYGIGWADALLEHEVTKDIAKLERYYYHFRENNYWDFTNNDKFVVLGENRRYTLTEEGIANTRPLEKSAFYIRFTYQPEGKPEYYSLLERVKKSTAQTMAEMMGLTVAQELKVYDQSHGGSFTSTLKDTVGIVVLNIDDNTAYARAAAKVTRDLVTTFAVSNAFEPLYRRFNEGVYIPSGIDAGVDDGGEHASDDPRLVKIYRAFNEPKVDYLYEDAMSVNAREGYKWENPSKGINYLSLENIFDHQDWMDQEVGHWPHNFSFYLDTAYVNRGTGHIKPQYLIMVGPQFINEHGCFICGENIPLRKGLYGRYLINATDSARGRDSGGNTQFGIVRDADYIWDTDWERLVFVPAIHIGDSLYILRCGLTYDDLRAFTAPLIIREDEMGVEYLHLESLITHANKKGSCIDIHDLGNNLHKDYVFSMRFYERYDYEHFLLESETTNRDTGAGRMIAPMMGGWVKWQNHEMAISRGSYFDAIRDGEKWNTEPTTDDPVANDKVAADAVKVIAGDGVVTILNAAGKKVTISNVLGQTVAGAVLTSDNAAIPAPKGILVVAVEGENAVKAVVK